MFDPDRLSQTLNVQTNVLSTSLALRTLSWGGRCRCRDSPVVRMNIAYRALYRNCISGPISLLLQDPIDLTMALFWHLVQAGERHTFVYSVGFLAPILYCHSAYFSEGLLNSLFLSRNAHPKCIQSVFPQPILRFLV